MKIDETKWNKVSKVSKVYSQKAYRPMSYTYNIKQYIFTCLGSRTHSIDINVMSRTTQKCASHTREQHLLKPVCESVKSIKNLHSPSADLRGSAHGIRKQQSLRPDCTGTQAGLSRCSSRMLEDTFTLGATHYNNNGNIYWMHSFPGVAKTFILV